MICHFIGVYIINRTLHGLLEIRNFSSSVEKYFTSKRTIKVKYNKSFDEPPIAVSNFLNLAVHWPSKL